MTHFSRFSDSLKIRNFRMFLGLTQTDFGNQYGLPQQTISDIENRKYIRHWGKIAVMVDKILADADAYKKNLEDMFTCPISVIEPPPVRKKNILTRFISIITYPFRSFQ